MHDTLRPTLDTGLTQRGLQAALATPLLDNLVLFCLLYTSRCV